MTNPTVTGIDLVLKLGAIGAPVSPKDVTLEMWRQQLAVAEASERVNGRQIRLLHAQRDVIDSQLAEVTRKQDDATRQVLDAERAIRDLTAPIVVDKLDPTDAEHRARAWRGQAGEIWQWYDGEHEGPAFLWTYEHPASGVRPAGGEVGGPFTEVPS
ncbi:hypothetical protein I5G87_gp60 [Mycobacterium phage Ekdilam]|uniref:Uncharacterized protein n=1 Tax=Mycobacterium phage Ekdilam TaxID=2599862 RepID=A0A5J6TN60_9CAUD|nr:hypothetical protein I5G87_gp60 [Mycobacterium phage Ekdilam]QFG11484.1 hypothetical protein PBI_EKDILAM_60 [Mycobacterium phage Ekdilam]